MKCDFKSVLDRRGYWGAEEFFRALAKLAASIPQAISQWDGPEENWGTIVVDDATVHNDAVIHVCFPYPFLVVRKEFKKYVKILPTEVEVISVRSLDDEIIPVDTPCLHQILKDYQIERMVAEGEKVISFNSLWWATVN